jgi:site-specific DNA recombinase
MTTNTASVDKETGAKERLSTKRAFAYVRVSSEAQTNTGFDRDGLSIGAQREAAEDKADLLDADLVHIWSDPGKSAFVDLHRRVEFLEMLDELKQLNRSEATRIDYVIVWSLSRWARNVQDHHRTRELVREAGAQLVSIAEPMIGNSDTPESFFMEGMFALNNQYESMKTGRNVAQGILQKAKSGGTYGPAKLGYQSDIERLANGRQVACVTFDPKRQPFITAAFQLFATGEYSLSVLSDELYELGLRSRPTKRHPNSSRRVKTSTLHRLLRDRYYAGWIVYKAGTPDEQTFQARHEPLIDQDTFDQVQELLDMARVSGERAQKHNHYLKGTVYCGECGGRMIYGLSRGKNGQQYPYFFCTSRIRGAACRMRANIRPELIEEAIDRHYAENPPQLELAEVERRTEAIEAIVAVSQGAVARVRAVKSELIDKFEGQQVRLLRLHAEEGGDVSPGAFRKERERLDREIAAARKSLDATEQQLILNGDLLRMALELAGDVAEVYRTAPVQLKRGFNQAFFKRITVIADQEEDSGEPIARVVDAELTKPFAVLTAENFTEKACSAAAEIHSGSAKTESGPHGAAFLRSIFDLHAYGGEGGIRTLERACAPYSLSRRVPSATRPPLRALRLRL